MVLPTNDDLSPERHLRSIYEHAESATADALEEAVDNPSFGRLMAWSAENMAAVTRIGADLADLTLRNLRIAGRADITRLARQLARTEDKLERVLQELEELRDEVRRREAKASNGRNPARPKPKGAQLRR